MGDTTAQRKTHTSTMTKVFIQNPTASNKYTPPGNVPNDAMVMCGGMEVLSVGGIVSMPRCDFTGEDRI